MRTSTPHKGSTREAKGLVQSRSSTQEDKDRRHRNKIRRHKRCLQKLWRRFTEEPSSASEAIAQSM